MWLLQNYLHSHNIVSGVVLHSHTHVHAGYILTQWITDAGRKTSLTKYLPLTLLQGFEKGCSGFVCERELETEQKLQYYGRHVVSFLFWCSTGGPEAHYAGWWLPLLHHQQLLWSPNSIGVPEGPLGQVWLSLPHLILLRLELELALDFCLDWAI